MIVEMRFALQTGIVMDNIPTIFYNTDGSQQRLVLALLSSLGHVVWVLTGRGLVTAI